MTKEQMQALRAGDKVRWNEPGTAAHDTTGTVVDQDEGMVGVEWDAPLSNDEVGACWFDHADGDHMERRA